MIVFHGDVENALPLGNGDDQTFRRIEHKKDDGIVRILKKRTKLAFDPMGNAGEKRGLIRMLRKRQNGKTENENAWIRIV